MANPDKKVTDWVAIEGEYRAGVESIRAIADRHGISEGAVRKQAKQKGWSRDPASTKRQIVRMAMAGGTHDGTHVALRTIEAAAAEDIVDMERGLRINRQCLIALETAAESVSEPREIKVIVEATSAAITSIRSIRNLDDAPTNKDDNADDDGFAEALASRLEAAVATRAGE